MIAKLISAKEVNRIEWDSLIRESDYSSVYAFTFFLDSISLSWQAIVVEEESRYLAVFPLLKGQKLGLTYYLQPIITKYWGVSIRKKAYKNSYEQYSYEKKILQLIIPLVPNGIKITYNLHPDFKYALPFSWAGYKLTTRFTYRIPLNKPFEELRINDFEAQARTDSNKALRLGYTVEKGNITDLIAVFRDNLSHNKTILEEQYFSQLEQLMSKDDAIQYFTILKTVYKGKIIGACMFGILNTICYYMYANKVFDKSLHSPLALITETAIQEAINHNCSYFDFTGMNKENIEFYWRKFGAIPTPYIQIHKSKIALI